MSGISSTIGNGLSLRLLGFILSNHRKSLNRRRRSVNSGCQLGLPFTRSTRRHPRETRVSCVARLTPVATAACSAPDVPRTHALWSTILQPQPRVLAPSSLQALWQQSLREFRPAFADQSRAYSWPALLSKTLQPWALNLWTAPELQPHQPHAE